MKRIPNLLTTNFQRRLIELLWGETWCDLRGFMGKKISEHSLSYFIDEPLRSRCISLTHNLSMKFRCVIH